MAYDLSGIDAFVTEAKKTPKFGAPPPAAPATKYDLSGLGSPEIDDSDRVRAALQYGESTQTPEQILRTKDLARRTGMPEVVVRGSEAAYENTLRLERNANLLKTAPGVRNMILNDPKVSALLVDEMGNATRIEQLFREKGFRAASEAQAQADVLIARPRLQESSITADTSLRDSAVLGLNRAAANTATGGELLGAVVDRFLSAVGSPFLPNTDGGRPNLEGLVGHSTAGLLGAVKNAAKEELQDPRMERFTQDLRAASGGTALGAMMELPRVLAAQEDSAGILTTFLTENLSQAIPAFAVGAGGGAVLAEPMKKAALKHLAEGVTKELLAKKLTPALAAAAGNSFAVVMQGSGANYTEAVRKGLSGQEAVNYALKKTAAEVPANMVAGALMAFKLGKSQLDNIVLQATAQGTGGATGAGMASASVGEAADPAELAMEFWGEFLGTPGDVAALAVVAPDAPSRLKMDQNLEALGKRLKDLNDDLGAKMNATEDEKVTADHLAQYGTQLEPLVLEMAQAIEARNAPPKANPERTAADMPLLALVSVIKTFKKTFGAGADTEEGVARVSEMFDLLAKSPNLTSDPETFAQFLQAVSSPDVTVSVPREKLVEAAQQAGVSEAELPSLAEQADVPGEVDLPLAELVSAFGTKAGAGVQELLQHLRTDVDLPTLAELKEKSGDLMGLLQKAAGRVMEKNKADEVWQASLDKVKAEVMADLDARGAFKNQAHATYVSGLVLPFYATLADAQGVTPEQARNGWVDAKGVVHKGYKFRVRPTDAFAGQDAAASAKIDYDKEVEFANRVVTGDAAVEDFEYYADYERTVAAEAALLPAGGNLLFVGSGPMPLSPIMFARQGFSVEGLDISPETKPLGEAVAAKAGVTLPVNIADATHFDFGKYQTVVLALEAGADAALKAAILAQVEKTMPKGGTILLRSSKTPEFVSVRDTLPDSFDVLGSTDTWGGLGETLAVRVGSTPVSSLQDFHTDLKDALQRRGWAVVTATQEAVGSWDHPDNIAANAKLEAELKKDGVEYETVSGAYKGVSQGPNFLVRMPQDAALKLGAAYGQESVLTRSGLVYADGSPTTPANHAKDIVGEAAKAEDFYSTLDSTGETFSVALDFPDLAQSVSTRTPTAKAGRGDPHLTTGLEVNLAELAGAEEFKAKLANTVKTYPGFKTKARKADSVIEDFVKHIENNLLWLYDQVPEEIRQRSKLWYDGGRRIVERLADKYAGRYSHPQIAGALAVMSPQMMWDANASLSERIIDTYTNQQDFAWTTAMRAAGDKIIAAVVAGRAAAVRKAAKTGTKVKEVDPEDEALALAINQVAGKTLRELDSPYLKAVWIRVYDEAHNARWFRELTPEGGFLGRYKLKDGERDKAAAWGNGIGTITKAVSILEDGSMQNISRQLGDKHKVRNFYNNLFDPSDPRSVTIDTHANAAGMLLPLGGSDTIVKHSMSGPPKDDATGHTGTYVLFAEAYRRAAASRGVLPRELQSITWEAVRGLFTDTFKTADKKSDTPIEAIWNRYTSGKATLDDTRNAILAAAGGIQPPRWVGSRTGLDEGGWASTYTGELLERSWADGTPGTGTGGVLAQSVSAAPGSLTVTGVHFSPQERSDLLPSMYGRGIDGAEKARVMAATDARIKRRTHFYVNVGNGIFPEAGVGSKAHVSTLPNLYDADVDALGLFKGRSGNALNDAESAVLDAGFSGYLSRTHNQSGAAVVFAPSAIPTEFVGGVAEAAARADKAPEPKFSETQKLRKEIIGSKKLPMGQMDVADWRKTLARVMPDQIGRIEASGVFDRLTGRVYRDEIARAIAPPTGELYQSASTPLERAKAQGFDVENPLYHWSPTGTFEQFNPFQHFGTAKAADTRYMWPADGVRTGAELQARTLNGLPGEGAVFPVFINKTKVVDIGQDTGSHDPLQLAWSIGRAMKKKDLFTTLIDETLDGMTDEQVKTWAEQNEYAYLMEPGEDMTLNGMRELMWLEYHDVDSRLNSDMSMDGYYSKQLVDIVGAQPLLDRLQGFLDREGVTALSYTNDVEDPGSVSYIVPNPENVRSVHAQFQGTGADDMLAQGGWYSPLTRAFEQAKQAAMPGSQWAAWLAGNKAKLGLKDDEIEYSGINEYLELRGKDKVTREEVVAYLDQDGVQVLDVTKADAAKKYDLATIEERLYETADRQGDERYKAAAIADADAALRAARRGEYTKLEELAGVTDIDLADYEVESDTKFASYVPPGGIPGTYREILVTLPTDTVANPTPAKRPLVIDMGSDENGRARFDVVANNITSDGRVLDSFNTWSEATDYALKVTEDEDIRNNLDWQKRKKPEFKSTHWEEKNVLVHVRLDEVTGADGKRYVRVVEVQSDWGQKGKKEGFAFKYKPEDVVAITTADDPAAAQPDVFWYFRVPGNVLQIPKSKYATEAAAREHVVRDKKVSGEVIPAPFVTDTKAWVALGIKRALMHALDVGADGVVFGTGQQNADLYDLSKQVDYIDYVREGDDKYRVAIVGKNGEGIDLPRETFTAAELENYVGKEVAQQIVDGKGEWDGGRKTLRGTDLKVGGEGMRSFYDKIVPQVANDVLKKLGGGKVSSIDVSAAEVTQSGSTFSVVVDGEVKKFRSYQDALAYLRKFGATESTQLGFAITPELRAKVEQGMPLFQGPQSPLGGFNPATLDITLLEGANLSTFVHELSHFFFTAYLDIASGRDAPARIVDDVNALLSWRGVNGVAEWGTLGFEQQRVHHEALAESFEQYVFTGKAPTKALQPFFRHMARWMTRVYGTLKEFFTRNGNANLTPEVSAVFDRMLATEGQLQEAEDQRAFTALFKTAAEAGVTTEEFAAYQALPAEARAVAEEAMRARSLRNMKWLQSRKNKTVAALQKEAAALRKETVAEVTAEVAARPIYRAMRWLKRGELTNPDTGEEIKAAAGNKLSIAALGELFPVGALVPPPDWRKLGYGQYGMLAKEGLHPDLVADMFGFNSGEDLVRSLVDAPKFSDEVEGLADQRMLEEHGDMVSAEAIDRAADEALHNDMRLKVLATELAFLNKLVGSPAMLVKAAKEQARAVVAMKTSKTLKPWFFAAAETRAGKAALAALGKGETEKAAEHKRQEVLNHALAKEAYAAEKELKALVARLQKIAAYKDDTSTTKSRDMDMVNAARALLAEFGIGSKRAGERATAYLGVLAKMDPDLSAALDEMITDSTTNAKDWRDLKLAELRELAESVEGIWYLAKRTRQIELDGQILALDQVRQELTAKLLSGATKKRVPGSDYAITKMERAKQNFSKNISRAKRPEAWVGMKDRERFGPWRKYVWMLINNAELQYQDAKAARLKQLKELLQPVLADMGAKQIAAPELGYTFGKGATLGYSELLHVLLHTGNGSNKTKLLLGRGWATENPDKSLNTGALPGGAAGWDAFLARAQKDGVITKAHWDFVQSVWDFMEELKPAAQKAHRGAFGRYFDEITAESFVTPFGTYSGGYVPAKTDPALQTDADMRALQEAGKESMAGVFPMPKRGFTKSRVTYNSMLQLDLRSLAKHVDEVLLFSYMSGPVRDVQRILRGGELKAALSTTDAEALNYLIMPWLQHAATQVVTHTDSRSPEAWRLWTVLRTRTGAAAMFANIANAIQQVSGVSNALLKVEKGQVMHALAHGVTNPRKLGRHVAAMSKYMDQRMHHDIGVLSGEIDAILLTPTKLEAASTWVQQHAYFAQIAVDNALSPILWLAKYNEVMENGTATTPAEVSALEKKAIELADSLIRTTQGSQRAIDVAAIETGSPFWRMFMQFTGYFNTMANLMGEEVAIAKTLPTLRKTSRLTGIALLGFWIPAVVGELVMQAMKGGPEDDDDDGEYLDDWLYTVLFMAPLRYATAMIPAVGTSVQALFNAFNDKPYDDRMATAPTISMLESSAKAISTGAKLLTDEDYEPKAARVIRDVGSLVSLATGVPVTPVTKAASYLTDVNEGNVVPENELDLARGIITGKAAPATKN